MAPEARAAEADFSGVCEECAGTLVARGPLVAPRVALQRTRQLMFAGESALRALSFYRVYVACEIPVAAMVRCLGALTVDCSLRLFGTRLMGRSRPAVKQHLRWDVLWE